MVSHAQLDEAKDQSSLCSGAVQMPLQEAPTGLGPLNLIAMVCLAMVVF